MVWPIDLKTAVIKKMLLQKCVNSAMPFRGDRYVKTAVAKDGVVEPYYITSSGAPYLKWI